MSTATTRLPTERTRRYGGFVLWAIVVVLLLAALIPPWINVSHYRGRVAEAISRALGRHVTASGISLRLLPRPGLVLSGFVVSDDPQYGAEAMLRADEVAAYLRLGSLWRGRLEIGTLSLDNPSLNLVRRSDGHWNLEELIQRTSQVSSAPTGARRPEARPRFPYIEATGGRINFKLGQVKKAFSFTDADFALWRQSESEWGVRLRARPMRTDLALSDTGLLRVDGRFQSAPQLRDTPVTLKVDFSKGQLGQISKLIYGRDRGWRGGTAITASLTGTPAALSVVLDASIDDFRRYDIALGESLRVLIHCTGGYSTIGDSLHDLVCDSPMKPGLLRISGNAANWGLNSYQFAVTAQQIPMNRVISFARHMKKDLPSDLSASGEVDATFDVRNGVDGQASWSGGGRTTQFALRSGILGQPLEVGALEFAVPGNPIPHPSKPPRRSGQQTRKSPAHSLPSAGFALLTNPFPLPMGGVSPAVVSGYFDEESYRATIGGEVELTRLVQVARALGIATPSIGLAGGANVELEVAGSWAGFAAPLTSGQLSLHDVSAKLQGVNEPLHIDSAKASLSGGQLNVASLNAGFAPGPLITGSTSFPLSCGEPGNCTIGFDLHTNDLSLDRLNQLLNPASRSSAWSRIFSLVQEQPDALLKAHLDGKFDVTHFHLGNLAADNVHGHLQMQAGKAQVDIARSDLLGGHHTGRWTGDFTQSPARYEGGGELQKIAIEQLATLMHDNWGTGQAAGKYAVVLRGGDAASALKSATGSLDFRWTSGSVRNLSLDGRPAPLAFTSLAGVLEIGSGKLAFDGCSLKTGNTVYGVKGTVGYDRALNIRLQHSGGPSYVIAGSLEQPKVQVVPSSSAEARLR